MSNTASQLTERDESILLTLAEKVRCLSIGQIGSFWWSNSARPQEVARTRLRSLEKLGWLRIVQVYARPLIALNEPITCWRPGDGVPNFAEISYRLKNRFSGPAKATSTVVASRQIGKRYGSPAGRAPRRAEATHDLGLAAVYLHFLRHDSVSANAWVSEAGLVAAGEGRDSKLADALLRLPFGETVIEFGGEYGKAKLEAFHDDCAERSRSYELW